MELARPDDLFEIFALYHVVVDEVNKTEIKLGWNVNVYPNLEFVANAIEKQEMFIIREQDCIVAVAVVNHNMNPEYDDIDWSIKEPKEKISTIHALAVLPECKGKTVSDRLLKDIEIYCREQGDHAIHLDVIDTNIPAYKMYLRNGYEEKACIKMYYEVVGTREFWMLEQVLV